MAKPFLHHEGDLPSLRVRNLLVEGKEEAAYLPPIHPKGGEVYLFSAKDKASKDDWKCDQMYWRNYGCKQLKTSPVVVKSYYVSVNPDGSDNTSFKRFSYQLLTSNKYLTLIHYKGNHTVAEKYKEPKRQTCPSVRREVEEKHQSPSVVYKNSTSCSVPQEYHSIFTPKNVKQVSNLQTRHRQILRLSHDALYNLHELSFDLQIFVQKIVTYPDLVVVCGLEPMFKNLNRLLTITEGQLMSYDTTFQLGDFYVSPLLFRNVLFSKTPVMPAAFLLHERKTKPCHEEMMRIIARELPNLVNGKKVVPLVTDDEKSFEAIDCFLPKITRLICWNHIITGVKVWLRQHGATSAEIPVYVSDLRELLHQPSALQYECQLETLKKKWSQPFYSHYMNELNIKIKQRCARWILDDLGLYNPISGITNNQSEGFNSVLKRMQDFKEIPVDNAILSLYHLQAFYWNEWQRGLAGFGEYVFSSIEYKTSYSIPTDEMHLLLTVNLEDIGKSVFKDVPDAVDNIKEDDLNLTDMTGESQEEVLSDSTIALKQKSNSREESSITACDSQLERARILIENGCVSHDPKMRSFTVMGSTNKPHVVTLHPKEYCSCPATSLCYHIIAVRLSVGIPYSTDIKKVNLTQLRKNTKGNAYRKSGRKRPRPGDYDVMPAPDSIQLSQGEKGKISKLDQQGEEVNHDSTDKNVELKRVNDHTSVINKEDLSWNNKVSPTNVVSSQLEEPVQGNKNVAVDATDIPSESCRGATKRIRCGVCDNCLSNDCGKCKYCLDKPKFGGAGRLRQSCVRKKCQNMQGSRKVLSDRVSNKPQIIQPACITPLNETGNNQSSPINVDNLPDKTIDDKSQQSCQYLARVPRALVTVSDFALVYKGEWLNDQNARFCLLPTTVFTKLMMGQADDTLDCYFAEYQLLNMDAIVMPCWLRDHWLLIIIRPQDKKILAFDSIGGYYTKVKKEINLLSNYLQKLVTSNREFLNLEKYTFIEQVCPRQNNLIDCGVFLCRFAYHVAFDSIHCIHDFESDSRAMRQWPVSLILESFKCVSVNVDKSLLLVAEQELISFGYTKTENVNDISFDETDSVSDNNLDKLLESESLDVIKRDKLLTPTFTNKSNPDDIFTLPYGYEFYIKYYPKLDRTQRPSVLFEWPFVREKVKSFEANTRYLYQNPHTSRFFHEKEFVLKNDIGGTNFWPIEYFDMALEITYYLQAVQCDIEKGSLPVMGSIMKRIIVPEILRYLISERFNVSPKEAFDVIKNQSFDIIM